jgi:hypothetical protein
MSGTAWRELIEDLQVERRKLAALVGSLSSLQEAWQAEGPTAERVDAAALRLQSFYTGIERCFTLIVRVLNGATSDGADWHRRLLERMAIPTEERPAVLQTGTAARLGEFLRFRHVVRHLYAYELDPPQVQRLLADVPQLWHDVDVDVQRFEEWLRELLAGKP